MVWVPHSLVTHLSQDRTLPSPPSARWNLRCTALGTLDARHTAGAHVPLHGSVQVFIRLLYKRKCIFSSPEKKKSQTKPDSVRTSQLHHTGGCLKTLFRFPQLHQCHAAVTDVVQTVHNMVCNGLYRTIFYIEQQCKQQLSLDSMNSPGVTLII